MWVRSVVRGHKSNNLINNSHWAKNLMSSINYTGWLPRWCFGETDFWEETWLWIPAWLSFLNLGPFSGCAALRVCYEASRQTAVRARWAIVLTPSVWSGHRLPFEGLFLLYRMWVGDLVYMCPLHSCGLTILLLFQYLGCEAEVTRCLRAAVLSICIK